MKKLIKTCVPGAVYHRGVKQLQRTCFNVRLRRRKIPLRYLLVMAPMRSGSSLLGHILAGNPAIGGWGEHHVGYETKSDLKALAYRVARVDTEFDLLRDQYAMDKLVWNYPVSDSVLNYPDVSCIFLMRDPVMMFNSAAGLGDVSSSHIKYQDPEVWMDYYRYRMRELRRLASRIDDPSRRLLLTYEELISNTDRVLPRLQQFLNVAEPFHERYRTTVRTGSLLYGDPSPGISSGRILRDSVHQPIRYRLPDVLAEEARCIQQEWVCFFGDSMQFAGVPAGERGSAFSVGRDVGVELPDLDVRRFLNEIESEPLDAACA
jgi:hypothetical protein